jgi:Sec7-like guanine-nucleotide exchange factor
MIRCLCVVVLPQVKAGVAFLFQAASKGKMKVTMDQIAQFLYTTEGLDKQDVGDFLGSDREKFMTIQDFNQLRAAYLKLFDFTGMTFDEGLRYDHNYG